MKSTLLVLCSIITAGISSSISDPKIFNNIEGECMAYSVIGKGGSAFKYDKQCVFPFTYKGYTYYQCTNAEWTAHWCATETSSNGEFIEGEWGGCITETCSVSLGGGNIDQKYFAYPIIGEGGSAFNNIKQCVFPFTYKGTTYDKCTNFEWDGFWCSTETSSNGDYVEGQWGQCITKFCSAQFSIDNFQPFK